MDADTYPHHMCGKWSVERDIQKYAVEHMKDTNSGLMILPCGTGKSYVGMAWAIQCKRARKILVLTSNQQASEQYSREIRQGTTFGKPRYAGDKGGYVLSVAAGDMVPPGISKPDTTDVVLVSHYTLFGQTTSSLSQSRNVTRASLKIILETKWDAVILDEAHMFTATNNKQLVENILCQPQYNSQHPPMLGMTATPYKENRASKQNRGKDCALWSSFKDVFRVSSTQIQREGYTARTYHVHVECNLADSFATRYKELVEREGINKRDATSANNVASITPSKIEAISTISNFHRALGHMGLVFFERLELIDIILEANVLPGFEIITGDTSPELRAERIQRLENGLIDGLLLSRAGDIAIDIRNKLLTYEIIVDSQGESRRQYIQRAGRVDRNISIPPYQDALDAKLLEIEKELPGYENWSERTFRKSCAYQHFEGLYSFDDRKKYRLENQKDAFVYLLFSANTKEVEIAARIRETLQWDEGYSPCKYGHAPISPSFTVVDSISFITDVKQDLMGIMSCSNIQHGDTVLLLSETEEQYLLDRLSDLRLSNLQERAEDKAVSALVKKERQKIQTQENKVKSAIHPLMKERCTSALKRQKIEFKKTIEDKCKIAKGDAAQKARDMDMNKRQKGSRRVAKQDK